MVRLSGEKKNPFIDVPRPLLPPAGLGSLKTLTSLTVPSPVQNLEPTLDNTPCPQKKLSLEVFLKKSNVPVYLLLIFLPPAPPPPSPPS